MGQFGERALSQFEMWTPWVWRVLEFSSRSCSDPELELELGL